MADTTPSQDLIDAITSSRDAYFGHRGHLQRTAESERLFAEAFTLGADFALDAPQPNAALADGWVPIKELGYDDDGEALLFKHAFGVVAAVWLNEDHPDAEGRGWHEAWSHKRLWDYTHMHALPVPPTLNARKEASNG
ncbi:hypothetical protein [Acidovorax sp. Leaf160]|uniref:hypothetical protein n=1 Tax=Acidovorax sp. Leaf160 TaxID=1736280 RepID=UPI0007013739|nr:hypothetical protein [Acidovorax sp. Leaf160]KQR62626.1 hypothetical protein ASF94_15505 [Acidovorax sp. Leaf160]